MTEQRVLRKVVSDVSSEIGKYIALESSTLIIDEQLAVKQAECECCGLKEDCTTDYIKRVEGCHCGKWVCGLCSEAVKERLLRAPNIALRDAVGFHREFCQRFNSTTRLNPKLSLTFAMRDIAQKSNQNRSSKNLSASKIARSTSCVPKIELCNTN
ncbi:hypothetical protein CCACVL1_05035 [Corchorus capsularis]|uniref:Uncharacterized protein n=1 Tax=Corchorus capsularis TaxID=210143 RepID=A0A1R3JMZ6_COCAP|nr:hypothetical protein CCACVL1_05035 [Corchorus capsularis]